MLGKKTERNGNSMTTLTTDLQSFSLCCISVVVVDFLCFQLSSDPLQTKASEALFDYANVELDYRCGDLLSVLHFQSD